MARKEKKYHFIYKTTNLLSGKYYIGMHSTDNLNDGYLGSGNRLRLAIKKHGKENFKIEILEFFENRKLLAEREAEIVNLELLAKKDCMNMKVGGIGGFPDSAKERFLWLMKNDNEFRESFSKKCTENNNKAIAEGRHIPISEKYSWVGKTRSEETKRKMSEAKKGTGLGENNSQSGTCWITKDKENKKVKKDDLEEYLANDWVKGKFTEIVGEAVITSKLTVDDVLEIKELLKEDILSQQKISERYNVKRETISKIKRGLIWKQV
jgi:predicted XRE-type DNA-binding protein